MQIASMRAWLISVTQLWNLYNMLPGPTSQSVAEQKKLKREYMKVRQEMNATSSQDEFAKWAKLRRQHDKLYEQLEKSSTLYIYFRLWHRP
jgi:hypothetical protein